MAQRLGAEDGSRSAQLVPGGGPGCPRSSAGSTSNTQWGPALFPPYPAGRTLPSLRPGTESRCPLRSPAVMSPQRVWGGEGPLETWLSGLP